jgi:phosphoribosyl-AMP cyclohydrolase
MIPSTISKSLLSMSQSSPITAPNFDAGHAQLLPVIAQDYHSGRVLMMAWMNEAAYEETLRTGQSLWRKGETSGHRQRIVKIQLDCDADCILLQVEQLGAACHDGYASCFYRTVQGDLSVSIDEQRLVDPDSVYRQNPAN